MWIFQGKSLYPLNAALDTWLLVSAQKDFVKTLSSASPYRCLSSERTISPRQLKCSLCKLFHTWTHHPSYKGSVHNDRVLRFQSNEESIILKGRQMCLCSFLDIRNREWHWYDLCWNWQTEKKIKHKICDVISYSLLRVYSREYRLWLDQNSAAG